MCWWLVLSVALQVPSQATRLTYRYDPGACSGADSTGSVPSSRWEKHPERDLAPGLPPGFGKTTKHLPQHRALTWDRAADTAIIGTWQVKVQHWTPVSDAIGATARREPQPPDLPD